MFFSFKEYISQTYVMLADFPFLPSKPSAAVHKVTYNLATYCGVPQMF